ncbi:MAG: MaoC family dehydratase [Bacteroidetes bacterium]|nr:MaoC family dehydratase [Bacteroidota bacterium]
MKQKKVIFRDAEIIEFCRATHDTNEIHDPVFMATLGKRVIVPGMFALTQTVSLSAGFLKNHANSLKVLFNSLLSSGDFVTLCTSSPEENPSEVRLSAINCKDTLTSNDEYTRLSVNETEFKADHKGKLFKLPVTPQQVESFSRLIRSEDSDVAHFLFAVAYASQALLRGINEPGTEVEKEIDEMINKNTAISPFYHTLEIRIPTPFPVFNPLGELDYFVHYDREKYWKLYGAYVRCEYRGKLIFLAHYKLVGIADRIILRMAKEIKHHQSA